MLHFILKGLEQKNASRSRRRLDSTRAASDLPVQLLDLEDKCQPIQELLTVAREAPQRPPASTLNGLPCGGPCEPQSLFLLHPASVCRLLLHMLINRPRWQIWTRSALIEAGH